MYSVRFMSLAALVCVWLGVSSVDAGRIKPVYPQKKWAVKKPDAVGLDVRKLDALSVAERAIQTPNIVSARGGLTLFFPHSKLMHAQLVLYG